MKFGRLTAVVPGTVQSVAQMYGELVGPPYSLEGREGMHKNQFQQLMHQMKAPMPRTGPFSSGINNRLFNMFDKRSRARVNLEDLLHGLHILSGESDRDKLTLAFKAFDVTNKGFLTLGDMATAIKDITNLLYIGSKIPTPDRVKVFAVGVMAPYNENKDESDYKISADRFIDSAADAPQIANLFSLGAIAIDDAKPAGDRESQSSHNAEHTGEKEEPPTPRRASDSAKPKSTPTSEAALPAGRGAGGGRGAAPPARGGLSRGTTEQHTYAQHHNTGNELSQSVLEGRERRQSASDKKRRPGDGKNATGTATTATTHTSPRRTRPEEKTSTDRVPSKREPRSEQEEPEETTEEMNARLVAHIRALQTELRKYMELDKENKQELEKLRSALQELNTENSQLKQKVHRTSQEFKQLSKEKVKEKGGSEKLLARKVGALESELAKQKNIEGEFAGLLQFLVGPPVERGLASTLGELRVIKCGYMLKRGDLIKNWKKRIFILRDNMQLIYYAPEERPQPRGVLDLRTVVMTRAPKDAPPNVIEIVTTSRQWFVACDTEEEAQEWMKLLNHLVETNKLRPAVGADRYMPPNRG